LTTPLQTVSFRPDFIAEIRPVVSVSDPVAQPESQPWRFGANVGLGMEVTPETLAAPDFHGWASAFPEHSKFSNLFFRTELITPLQGEFQR